MGDAFKRAQQLDDECFAKAVSLANYNDLMKEGYMKMCHELKNHPVRVKCTELLTRRQQAFATLKRIREERDAVDVEIKKLQCRRDALTKQGDEVAIFIRSSNATLDELYLKLKMES